MIAEAQRRGGICAFIDAEHAMDPTYARRIGVNIDELLVSQPDTGEQALEIAELLIRSGAVDVVAIDSVAALTPKAEIEGEMGDSHVGLQARLMSQALRKLAGTLNRTDTICLFTNQLREKIGVMFGSPETTPGGRALKFYSSVRLDIRRIETLKEGTEAIGNRVRVKVVKNKVAPPFKQAEFDVIYGHGISWEGTVLDVGLERKIVTKSGSYFSFGDERLGQGRQNATAFLQENPDLVQAILAPHPGGSRARAGGVGPAPAHGGCAGGGRDAGHRRGAIGGCDARRRRGGVGGLSRARLSGCRSSRRSARATGASPSSSTARPGGRCPARRSLEAGLAVGLELDRERARALGRALRRHRARDTAVRTLARREHSRASLATRLERAGVRAGDVDATCSTRPRAQGSSTTHALPCRGHVRSSRGAPAIFSCSTTWLATGSRMQTARAALSGVEPETVRAARIVSARGSSARTLQVPRLAWVLRGVARDARCRSGERSARMTMLHPTFPCTRVVPEPLRPVTLVSTTDLSSQRARLDAHAGGRAGLEPRTSGARIRPNVGGTPDVSSRGGRRGQCQPLREEWRCSR